MKSRHRLYVLMTVCVFVVVAALGIGIRYAVDSHFVRYAAESGFSAYVPSDYHGENTPVKTFEYSFGDGSFQKGKLLLSVAVYRQDESTGLDYKIVYTYRWEVSPVYRGDDAVILSVNGAKTGLDPGNAQFYAMCSIRNGLSHFTQTPYGYRITPQKQSDNVLVTAKLAQNKVLTDGKSIQSYYYSKMTVSGELEVKAQSGFEVSLCYYHSTREGGFSASPVYGGFSVKGDAYEKYEAVVSMN